jgi:hypothetical protein
MILLLPFRQSQKLIVPLSISYLLKIEADRMKERTEQRMKEKVILIGNERDVP